MRLFVGLGNPTKEYRHTRHNLGQDTILKLVADEGLTFKNYSKLSAQIAEYGEPKNLLAVTCDFMNNSGIPVQKIINFFKINLQNVYIVHDDLDLPIGEYRIQFNRGPAGHNGIQSIIDHLGTQGFHRIRIGIGKPENNNIAIEDYVLQNFSPEETKILDDTKNRVIDEIKMICSLPLGPIV